MSILLDAVTRSKQQELDSSIDPVLTPRAQYDNFAHRGTRSILLVLGCLIILLLGVIAWLTRSYFISSSHQVEQREDRQTIQAISSPLESKPVHTTEADNAGRGDGISLAGKVALPIARQMPAFSREESIATVTADARSSVNVVSPAKTSNEALRQSVLEASKTIDSGDYQLSSNEPIILGAHANDRGQALLDSLKYQVNVAADEVGMQQLTDKEQKEYQSENNLLAAFEAALKEVEIENSVAAPVTPAKLDPIPTPKPDELPKYGQLPAGIQLQVPEFNINAHVYSSVASNRWLNVDGNELQEGDMIGGKLTIVEIRPRDVVLSIQDTEFKVPAI